MNNSKRFFRITLAALGLGGAACGSDVRAVGGRLDSASLGESKAELVATNERGVTKVTPLSGSGEFRVELDVGSTYALAFRAPGATTAFAHLVTNNSKSHVVRIVAGEDINLGVVHAVGVAASLTAGLSGSGSEGETGSEAEAGDDRGNDGVEAGDDHGDDGVEAGDDHGDDGVEAGDDHGDDGVEAGDDHGDDGVEAGDDSVRVTGVEWPEGSTETCRAPAEGTITTHASFLVAGSVDLAETNEIPAPESAGPLADADGDLRVDTLDDDDDGDGVCDDHDSSDDDDSDSDSDSDSDGDSDGDSDDSGDGESGDEPNGGESDGGESGDEPSGGESDGGESGGEPSGGSGDGSEGGSEDESAGRADLPYDVRLQPGDSFKLTDAFLEKGPEPAAILDVDMNGSAWRAEELTSNLEFVVTAEDCAHEGNRSTGRDRIFVLWQNADGSTELDHLDLRYCD